MNRDGSNVRQLTHDSAYDGEPSYSPDGSKIAFSSKRSGGYRIWVMNANGTGAQMLSWEASSGRPSWSPDGQRIAFHADGNNDTWFDVFVMNANGSSHVKLYDGSYAGGSGYDGYAGSWSPDGRYVSYTSVYWVQYGNNWYWQTARPSYVEVDWGGSSYFNYDWSMGWDPDWQTADASPPYSRIYPLAAHSRDKVEVSWTAQEVGEAGLNEVLVQYRVGEDGNWTEWSTTTDQNYWHKTFDKQSGETVYFRVRAEDKAGNIEAWPAEGFDAQTTFYDWLVGGQIRDNRGQPLAGAAVIAGPEAFEIHPSDANGTYRAYFKGIDYTFSPSWGRDGYGQLPETTMCSDSDKGFDAVLPPADNMVADWGFESGVLNGGPWQTTGDIAPVVGEAYRHSGDFGAFLGLPFDLEAPASVRQFSYFNGSPLIKSDDSGALHMLWRQGSGWDQVLYYASKPAGGAWSEPLALSGAASNIQQVMWDLTSAGKIHVVWKEYDYSGDTIYHIWRSAAGVWSEAKIVHSEGWITLVDLEVENNGNAHLIWQLEYTDYDDYYYSKASAAGQWDSPIPTHMPGNWSSMTDLALGPDGRPHLVSRSGDISYSYLQDDGTWSSRETVFPDDQLWYLGLVIDPDNQAHVVWATLLQGKLYHRWRSVAGVWSQVTTLSTVTWDVDTRSLAFLIDQHGTLHVTWSDYGDLACNVLYYMRKDGDADWSSPMIVSGDDGCVGKSWLQDNAGTTYLLFHSPLQEDDYFCSVHLGASTPGAPVCTASLFDEYPGVLVDKDGAVQAIWKRAAEGGGYVLNCTQSKAATTNDASGVSQQVTIPMTLTNPTLSVMYSLQGGKAGSDARLMAQMEDGSGPATVFETDAVTAWDHEWADVSAWAGQTVTLTVQVEQATGVPQVGVLLDEVTLGSSLPDLWLALDGPPSAATGEAFNLEVDYGNRTPSLADGVQISLTLPAGLSYVSADPLPNETSPALIWNLGDLASAETQPTIVVTVTMEAEFAPGLWVSTTGEITSQGVEIETANNASSYAIRVGRLVRLPIIVH